MFIAAVAPVDATNTSQLTTDTSAADDKIAVDAAFVPEFVTEHSFAQAPAPRLSVGFDAPLVIARHMTVR